jgi:hypothetical protein
MFGTYNSSTVKHEAQFWFVVGVVIGTVGTSFICWFFS